MLMKSPGSLIPHSWLHADSLPRGYPAAPLSPQGSRLLDAWQHQPVTLKGISWPGFNRRPAGLEGLGGAQSAMEASDFRAIVYQLKLLGECCAASVICHVAYFWVWTAGSGCSVQCTAKAGCACNVILIVSRHTWRDMQCIMCLVCGLQSGCITPEARTAVVLIPTFSWAAVDLQHRLQHSQAAIQLPGTKGKMPVQASQHKSYCLCCQSRCDNPVDTSRGDTPRSCMESGGMCIWLSNC